MDVEEEGSGGPELWELRRSYHDRIAEIRQRSLDIVGFSAGGVEKATTALLDGDESVVFGLDEGFGELRNEVAGIDSDVVALLALESPVARDLRIILATRDVAQIGLLCAGLCVALAGRAGGAARSLVSPITEIVIEVSAGTSGVLAMAAQAWSGLDDEAAVAVLGPLEEARMAQTRLVAALLDLEGVPMDAALDLAMATRAFERLADHAEELAGRVCFATGRPWPVAD